MEFFGGLMNITQGYPRVAIKIGWKIGGYFDVIYMQREI